MRWPMQQFLRRPSPYMGIYTVDELNAMNDMIDLVQRIPHLATALRCS